MEKYCPKCHKVYSDMKAKFCTNCATQLITREKRKPIPPELRHRIFVRDGYRCRECGKSREETSLEIDHILPLSKGGLTTENNLWTLCRECNQAKKDTIWQDDEIEITRNELNNLKNQLYESERGLEQTNDEDEIVDYKFKIKKLNEEYIPNIETKLNNLVKQQKIEELNKQKQQEENKRKEKLFKKLYVELDNEIILQLCNYFSLNESNNEDNLRLLVDKYSENEINNTIILIKRDLERQKLIKSLNDNLNNQDIKLFAKKFSLSHNKDKVINYLSDEFTLIQINKIKKELYEIEIKQKKIEEQKQRDLKRQKKLEEEKKRKLEQRKKYEEMEISRRKNLKEKRINDLKQIFDDKFDEEDLLIFAEVLKEHIKTKNQLLNILLDYPDVKINIIFDDAESKIRVNLMNEIQKFNLAECIAFSKYFSLNSFKKQDILKSTYNLPVKKIKYVVNDLKASKNKSNELKKHIEKLIQESDERSSKSKIPDFFKELQKSKSPIKAAAKANIDYELIVKWYKEGENENPKFLNFHNRIDAILSDLYDDLPELRPH